MFDYTKKVVTTYGEQTLPNGPKIIALRHACDEGDKQACAKIGGEVKPTYR